MIYDGYAQNSVIQKTGSRIKSTRLAQLVRSLTTNQEAPGSISGLGEG